MRPSPKTKSARQKTALAMIAVLVVPVLLAGAGAAQTPSRSDDEVVIADGNVPWRPQPNMKTVLYFGPPSGGPEDPGAHPMRAYPYQYDPENRVLDRPHARLYGAALPTGDSGSAASAIIRSVPLTHDVTIRGDNALTVHWEGQWDASGPWRVQVQVIPQDAPGTLRPIAEVSDVQCSGSSTFGLAKACTVAVPLGNGDNTDPNPERAQSRTFENGDTIQVTITYGAGAPWTLVTGDPDRPSYLEVISEDAVKVATWTTDHSSKVKSAFRPSYDDPRAINKLDAFFAVKSAFGISEFYDEYGSTSPDDNEPGKPLDAQAGVLYKGNESSYPITLNDTLKNQTSIGLKYDEANSSLEQGLVVYRLPTYWDYGQWQRPIGDFVLQSTAAFRQGDPLQGRSVTAEWDFVVGAQGVTIRPFDDADEDTLPSPLETQDHELAAGGSTTFLALVRNDGDVPDNFTLELTRVSSVPSSGWSASIASTNLTRGNVLFLAPGQESLVRVTVRAPEDAAMGNSAVYSLVAESEVDPETKSEPYTVIATVTPNIKEGADLIILEDPVEVQRGKERLVTVYLWNTGNRPASLRLSVGEGADSDAWKVAIDQNGARLNETTVPTVPAGDVAIVQLRVGAGTGQEGGSTQDVVLNATLAGGGGGRDRTITLEVVEFLSFRVDLLRGINSITRYLEMSCQDAGPECETTPVLGDTQDHVDGTLYRVWITNTGDVADTFRVRALNPREVGETVESREAAFLEPKVVYRDSRGRFDPASASSELSVPVSAGETAEVYVWVGHESDVSQFQPSQFSFTLSVKSERTDRELRRPASAIAWNSDGRDLDYDRRVKIEAVERASDYDSSHNVEIDLADTNVLEKLVDPSSAHPAYFRLRVTNGASFSKHDADADNASVKLTLLGAELARQNGWNVSMRFRNGDTDERTNPWKETLFVDNVNYENGRRESFWDTEVEVKMVPPEGGGPTRILANQVQTVTLRAQFPATAVEDQIELAARIAPIPNVTLEAHRLEENVHPGGETAFILKIANNGTRASAFNLKARFDEPTEDTWLGAMEQNLNLTAQENQTVALIVGAPSNAAPGQRGLMNVTLTFDRVPGDPSKGQVQKFLELEANVVAPGSLDLTAFPSTADVRPGGRANYTLHLTNDGNQDVSYDVTVTPLNNWTQSIPRTGSISVGATNRLPYILDAPTDVVQDRGYGSLVKVAERGNENNFAVVTVTTNIVGGTPFPVVNAVNLERLIDRGAEARFEFAVKNLGNREATFPLDARAGGNGWAARVENANGEEITGVRVGPNALEPVFVVVTAPMNVPEGTKAPVTLTAYNPNYDRTSAATVRALIHDYGVDVTLQNARVDVIPGESAEFSATITNLGNGVDNLTVTADLQGLGDWSARTTADSVTLQPGATTTVRIIVTSPKEALPSARSYTMSVRAGTEGGAAVGLAKNDSAPFVLNVLNYRAFDVDADGFLELAVDKNQRSGDGLEHFIEIFSEGTRLVEVDNLSGKQDGKITFLLDSSEGGALDGIADLYFDANDLFVYVIRYAPDINGDATPDYLLDTDNDGVIDHVWDSATRSLWQTTVIRAYGGTREQFLIDLNGNGEADRFYDPDGADGRGLVTRTIPQEDGRLGLDTRNDGRADTYYDVESGEVADARVSSLADFAREFWYFFAGFALVLVLAAVVIGRRRNA